MKVAILAVTALLAAGCMGSSKSGEGTTTASAPPPPAATSGPPQTFLTIVIWPFGKKNRPKVFRLPCRGGENAPGNAARPVPNKAASCRRLLRLGPKDFAPVRSNVACTQVYGGPAIAEMTGLLKGRLLKARFTRTDGCEIARWDRVKFLLPIRLP
jgi:hypothetical protein